MLRIIVLAFLISACSSKQFEFFAFTYPEHIGYEKSGWKKACIITVSTSSIESMNNFNKKNIDIKIKDSEGAVYDLGSYDLVAGSFSPQVSCINENAIDVVFGETNLEQNSQSQAKLFHRASYYFSGKSWQKINAY